MRISQEVLAFESKMVQDKNELGKMAEEGFLEYRTSKYIENVLEPLGFLLQKNIG